MASGPRMKLRHEPPTRKAAPAPPAPLDLRGLEDDLELACLTAIRGDAAGPFLAKTLERVCLDVLRSKGLGQARVKATSTRRETMVAIQLAPTGPLAREIVIRTG